MTRMDTLLRDSGSPASESSFKFQDLCDGISREQTRMKQLTRDHSILSARDRVLSARSYITDTSSLRSSSRLSSVRKRHGSGRDSFRNPEVESKPDIDSRPDINDEADVVSNGSSGNHGKDDKDTDENKQLAAVPMESGDSRPQTPALSEYADSTARSETDGNERHMGISEDDLTKLSDFRGTSEPLMRSYASLSGVAVTPARSMCLRSKSAVSREVDGMVRSLSRHCCDVLGPKVCHDCALVKRRLHDDSRHEVSLSRLHISERNFADKIVLHKMLPHLSPDEIEDRVAMGDILRMPLRERLYERKARLSSVNRRSSSSLLSTRSSNTDSYHAPTQFNKAGTSQSFFMNIQDLNCKIMVSNFQRKISARSHDSLLPSCSNSITGSSSNEAMGSLSERTSMQSQQVPERKPAQRAWQPYGPPLLPKVCQNVEPAFFAGRSGEYKLPDRLPDQVVEGQITDLSSLDPQWTGSYPQSEAEEAS